MFKWYNTILVERGLFMLKKSQMFNYLTLIFAIITICLAVVTIIYKFNSIFSIICMIVTLIFSSTSRKINEKESELTEEERALFSNINKKSEEK
jgi:hypothetical protein